MKFNAWALEKAGSCFIANSGIHNVVVDKISALSHSDQPKQVVPTPDLEPLKKVPLQVETKLEKLRISGVGSISSKNVETVTPVECHIPLHEIRHECGFCLAGE